VAIDTARCIMETKRVYLIDTNEPLLSEKTAENDIFCTLSVDYNSGSVNFFVDDFYLEFIATSIEECEYPNTVTIYDNDTYYIFSSEAHMRLEE
jgi:hypothetical protein